MQSSRAAQLNRAMGLDLSLDLGIQLATQQLEVSGNEGREAVELECLSFQRDLKLLSLEAGIPFELNFALQFTFCFTQLDGLN